jgi:hypothetical protein
MTDQKESEEKPLIIATMNVPWSDDLPEIVERLMEKKFLVREIRVVPVDGDAKEARLDLFLEEVDALMFEVSAEQMAKA